MPYKIVGILKIVETLRLGTRENQHLTSQRHRAEEFGWMATLVKGPVVPIAFSFLASARVLMPRVCVHRSRVLERRRPMPQNLHMIL